MDVLGVISCVVSALKSSMYRRALLNIQEDTSFLVTCTVADTTNHPVRRPLNLNGIVSSNQFQVLTPSYRSKKNVF